MCASSVEICPALWSAILPSAIVTRLQRKTQSDRRQFDIACDRLNWRSARIIFCGIVAQHAHHRHIRTRLHIGRNRPHDALFSLYAYPVDIRYAGNLKNSLIAKLSDRLIGRSIRNYYDIFESIFVLRYINDSYANRFAVYNIACFEILKCSEHIFLLGRVRRYHNRHGIVRPASFMLQNAR